jgi:hypothetical protein
MVANDLRELGGNPDRYPALRGVAEDRPILPMSLIFAMGEH